MVEENQEAGVEAKTVTFKYERLDIFYYLCGKLGHADDACELRYTVGVEDGARGWGPELRAETRRLGGGGGRSKWLRDDSQGEWRSHVINAERKFWSDRRRFGGNQTETVFENPKANNGGSEMDRKRQRAME